MIWICRPSEVHSLRTQRAGITACSCAEAQRTPPTRTSAIAGLLSYVYDRQNESPGDAANDICEPIEIPIHHAFHEKGLSTGSEPRKRPEAVRVFSKDRLTPVADHTDEATTPADNIRSTDPGTTARGQ